MVSGASSLNHDDGKSQGGFIVAITDQGFVNGDLCAFNMIRWGSRRLRRCVRASLGSETLALDDGLSEAEWMRALWAEAMDPRTCVREDTLYGEWDTVAVVRHLGPKDSDPPTAMVVDAKGLYDHLARPAASGGSHEKRTMVDIKVMTQSVAALKGQVMWIP